MDNSRRPNFFKRSLTTEHLQFLREDWQADLSVLKDQLCHLDPRSQWVEICHLQGQARLFETLLSDEYGAALLQKWNQVKNDELD